MLQSMRIYGSNGGMVADTGLVSLGLDCRLVTNLEKCNDWSPQHRKCELVRQGQQPTTEKNPHPFVSNIRRSRPYVCCRRPPFLIAFLDRLNSAMLADSEQDLLRGRLTFLLIKMEKTQVENRPDESNYE